MSTATFDNAARAFDGGELRALFGACADGTPAAARDAAAFASMVGDGLLPPEWLRAGMVSVDAAFALMFGCGLCRADAAAVNVADLDRESGATRIRTAYATDGPAAALDAWLTVRGKRRGPLLAPVSQGGAVQAAVA